MAASDQIRQMVNFILQEAHEKANEIRVKVCVVFLFVFVFVCDLCTSRQALPKQVKASRSALP